MPAQLLPDPQEGQLQADGATAFVADWNDLLGHIDSQSASVSK